MSDRSELDLPKPASQAELDEQIEYVKYLRESLEKEIRRHNPHSVYLEPIEKAIPCSSVYALMDWRFAVPSVEHDVAAAGAHMRMVYKSPNSPHPIPLGYAANDYSMQHDGYLAKYEFVKQTAEQIALQWWDIIKRQENL